MIGATAMILAAALSWGAAAEEACPAPLASFRDLAERLEDLGEVEGATILNAELMVSPSNPCRATWIVEILSPDDEVIPIVFDARTLEERGESLDLLREAYGEEEAYPVYMTLTGGPARDILEGFWSDDVMRGGDGPDLFVVTPGADVIEDFEPDQDLLDVGDFARGEEGLENLRTLAALARAATETAEGLVLDLDGEEGDWTLMLEGLRLADLTRENVYFGLREPAPPFEIESLPAYQVEMSDGAVLAMPSAPLDGPPPAVELIEGEEETAEMAEELITEFWEALGGGE